MSPDTSPSPRPRSHPSRWGPGGRFWNHPGTSVGLTLFATVVGWNVAWLVRMLVGELRDVPYRDQGTDPFSYCLASIAMQLTTAGVVWLASGRRPMQRRARLALRRPPLSNGELLLVALSGIGLHNLWTHAMQWLAYLGQANGEVAYSSSLQALAASAHDMESYVLILASFMTAGVCEELVCRGFLMRRLARRWSAQSAIGASAFVFACLHLHPTHALGVLPLGVWLGYLAWKTRSTVTSMIAHLGVLSYIACSWWLTRSLTGDGSSDTAKHAHLALWLAGTLAGIIAALRLRKQLDARNGPKSPELVPTEST